MKHRLFLWALTSSLAGFLFGFDTVVISGVEKTIQSLWNLSSAQHGLALSMALWGTVLGSMFGGWPTDHWGRKKTLISIGLLYFVSAVWSGMANDVYSFMIARFIGGVGVGISTVAAPLYISEISPPERRGRLTGLFQFNIVFGILIAFLSNYLIQEYVTVDAWRWMLGVEAIPALIYTAMTFTLPESPRWLIAQKGDRPAGVKVLQMVNADESPESIDALADEIELAAADESQTAEAFWTKRLRKPIILAFLIAFFNQLSGINAILYFAPRIFQLAGLGEDAALLNSIGIGVTNLLFTFVGLYLIDRLGRRTLLYIGSLGYIASLGLCAWAFFNYAPPFKVANSAVTLTDAIDNSERINSLQQPKAADVAKAAADLTAARESLAESTQAEGFEGEPVVLTPEMSHDQMKEAASGALTEASELSGSGGNLVLVCIFAFIASHAVGQGAVIWVFISEIFPNRHRAMGQALGCSTHWVFAALMTFFFPIAIAAFAPGYVFGFFCFMMCLQLLWVATMVPETKGVPLEHVQEQLGIV